MLSTSWLRGVSVADDTRCVKHSDIVLIAAPPALCDVNLFYASRLPLLLLAFTAEGGGGLVQCTTAHAFSGYAYA